MKIECQSASNPKWKFIIIIHRVEPEHYVGFIYGIVESGAIHPDRPFVGKTEEEVINKSKAWVKQQIPDCKCSS